MTFLEAALNILSREKRPLHFKDLTERAMTKKLLTFVGRTPEVTMQDAAPTAAVKKAPGNPFVRVKPGVFGLLRYPELPPEEPEAAAEKVDDAKPVKTDARDGAAGEIGGRGRRRRRRGGRGRERDETVGANGAEPASGEADLEENDEPTVRGMSAAARAAALAETGVLEGDDGVEGDDDDDATESGREERMSQGGDASAGAPASATEGLDTEADASAAGDDGEGDDEGDDLEEGTAESAGAEGAVPRGPGEPRGAAMSSAPADADDDADDGAAQATGSARARRDHLSSAARRRSWRAAARWVPPRRRPRLEMRPAHPTACPRAKGRVPAAS